jgi:hypothetical protein
MSEWQPIETAPFFAFNKETWYKNGPRYLLFAGYEVIGSYGYTEKGKGRWQADGRIINPTHWMPLPERPQ